MNIREVDAATVRPLRRAVLRPGRPAEESVYAADEHALHLAAYDGEQVIGVATYFPDPLDDDQEAWRLRGMAVDPSWQRSGVGSALLAEGERILRSRGVRAVWCKARLTAVGFYQRHGWVGVGEPFEIPALGPHVSMRCAVPQHSAVQGGTSPD